MIVAEQVKNAMDHEQVEFLDEGDPMLSCLPCGGLHADHHVSKDGVFRESKGPLPLGKGQHVGRAVPAQVSPVQGADGSVADERDGKFGPRKAKPGEGPRNGSRQSFAVHGELALPVQDGDAITAWVFPSAVWTSFLWTSRLFHTLR